MSESKSLLIAAFLSALTVIVWQFFFYTPVTTENRVTSLMSGDSNNYPVEVSKKVNRKDILSDGSRRLLISNGKLHGSIALNGARFDDITLIDYREAIDPNSDEIVLFSPAKSHESYFAEFGWVSVDENISLPNGQTIWNADKNKLSVNGEVNLQWDNGEGLLFKIKVRIDDKYMFHVEQYVINSTDKIVKLIPYGRLNRSEPVEKNSSFIFHEGPVAIFDDKFEEFSYKKLKRYKISQSFNKGWFGFADKYWFASVVPFSNKPIKSHLKYVNDKYQLDFTQHEVLIEPHTTASTFSYLFVGAKDIDILDDYSRSLNIKSFDRVVDFGILYFITKPIFLLLQYINSWLGNFGLAILLLTVLVRIFLLPLSVKATVSMLKMRKLKPELQRLKKLYANDKLKMNQEVLSLFKKNNVTPMAGLFPSLVQIPVFFALYKVLSITIEMRHASFYGWIKDLSARDPTNIFTLFGLLNWNPPQILNIGVLPLLLGATMILQQKISASYQSYDSAQADAMKFIPYIFTFLFASFPSGLVLYWVWNNFLSIAQQFIITKVKFKE